MTGKRLSDQHLPLTDELAGVVARMSGLLLTHETVETALGLLSALAHETVHGASGAGVSTMVGGRRVSSGSTDDRVRQADALQYELDEGPCLAAFSGREVVRVDDLTRDRRWPRWAEATVPLGFRATLSAPLVAGDTSLGAIKVYADTPGAFDPRSEQLLSLFSAQAAVLVANVQAYDRAKRLSDGLREAVRGRDVVNMAKGVLMGRSNLDEDAAVTVLIRNAQRDGTTVAAAAEAVVESTARRRR
ncbi:GAF and ANTAR domain-containing protein [Blastococcus haudaquaticus]|uniref:GAF domain-containing protein n=1 Tax=Blastococcus haudaquaticus TaxID=1938745 RepID=A0A286H6L3_9ACTN|nr:GAF and ANTAR domain-containing protein [Blastococcus haudaquaticus]SOE03408.1 GAF domain-containing protein [Blastococcus haudaquaticus]